jgi:uncharacterized membrane protein
LSGENDTCVSDSDVRIVLLLVGVVACSDSVAPPPATAPATAAATVINGVKIATGVHAATLPGLDGPTFTARAINDWAEVVGTVTAAGGGTSAFHWQLTRGLTVLSASSATAGAAVNNFGDVAVTLSTDTGAVAGVWPWSGPVRALRRLSSFHQGPAAPSCVARGINNARMLVGTCYVPVLDEETPTLWTADGRPDGLHPGGGSSGVPVEGFAYALSNAGFVAGGPDESSLSPTAFLFTPADMLVPLPSELTGMASSSWAALAVNDSGWAAGYSPSPSAPCLRAVAWLRSNAINDLGTCGSATGITDDAVVVGTATDSAGNALYAFVWTADSGLRRLPGLDANGANETSSAVAINSSHQIVGSITSQGAQHAIMWTLPASFTGSAAVIASNR